MAHAPPGRTARGPPPLLRHQGDSGWHGAPVCAIVGFTSDAPPHIPYASPDSKPEKIRSIEQLLRSRWAQLAEDPELRRKIPAMLRELLERIPSSHPVVNRIRLALRLFERESAGSLVNSRNLIILSAALLYTFWPADAIPDLLPLVGWLDDVGLLTMVLTYLAATFQKDAPAEESEVEPPKEEPRPEASAAESPEPRRVEVEVVEEAPSHKKRP